MRIFVLSITHQHGVNVSAFQTKEGAQASLLEYVNEWWDSEVPKDIDVPASDAEKINVYFEVVYGEYYDLEEVELEP